MSPNTPDHGHIAIVYDGINPKTGQKWQLKDWNCFDHLYYNQIIYHTILHLAAFYGLYLCFNQAKLLTVLFGISLHYMSYFGISAAVHRYWSHRAFKATPLMRVLLMILNSMAYQSPIIHFARDHRLHHKYTETDADNVDSRRGLFFSHMGWLLCKKHPEVIRLGRKIYIQDLLDDPLVRFQKKYYLYLVLICCYTIPTLLPWYFWSESLWNAYFICAALRHCVGCHATYLVNSVAHKWGLKPYDINIAPTDNQAVSYLTLGEGWHNYHHAFPYDWRVSEWGSRINFTTFVLTQFAKIGWVYDMRQASASMIQARQARTGPYAQKYTVFENTRGKENDHLIIN